MNENDNEPGMKEILEELREIRKNIGFFGAALVVMLMFVVIAIQW